MNDAKAIDRGSNRLPGTNRSGAVVHRSYTNYTKISAQQTKAALSLNEHSVAEPQVDGAILRTKSYSSSGHSGHSDQHSQKET